MISALLHVAAVAWLAGPTVWSKRPVPSVPATPAARPVTWLVLRPAPTPATPPAAAPRRLASPPRPAPPRPSAPPLPVAVVAEAAEPPQAAASAPVSAPLFAPPRFGGWGRPRRAEPAPVDPALLAMAQQQRLQAAGMAQAQAAWASAERGLRAAAPTDD